MSEKKWIASDGTELRPFDKVLVRDDGGIWTPQFLSCCVDNGIHYYTMDGNTYEQCIPYKANEALVDTVAPIPKPRQDAPQPDKPLEWGERVLVWNDNPNYKKDAIFARELIVTKYPYEVLERGEQQVSLWKHCERV